MPFAARMLLTLKGETGERTNETRKLSWASLRWVDGWHAVIFNMNGFSTIFLADFNEHLKFCNWISWIYDIEPRRRNQMLRSFCLGPNQMNFISSSTVAQHDDDKLIFLKFGGPCETILFTCLYWYLYLFRFARMAIAAWKFGRWRVKTRSIVCRMRTR